MSTRCLIAKVQENDFLTVAYCHFDGYLAGVGQTLIDNYNAEDRETEEKIDQLTCLRSFSSLRETVEKTAKERHSDVEAAASLAECEQYTWSELLEDSIGIDYIYVRVGQNFRGEWIVYSTRNQQFARLDDAVDLVNAKKSA